jgi:hypothetical protein
MDRLERKCNFLPFLVMRHKDAHSRISPGYIGCFKKIPIFVVFLIGAILGLNDREATAYESGDAHPGACIGAQANGISRRALRKA